MTLTHEYYEELTKSLLKSGAEKTISKHYIGNNGTRLVYAISYQFLLRKLYIKTSGACIEDIPKCNGIDVNVVKLHEFSHDDEYFELSQNKDADPEIFEIIVEEIRKVAETHVETRIIMSVSSILSKWKNFFALGKQVLLSTERQQGLFGELLFLKKLIDVFGPIAVSYWSGCKSEIHDFYIKKSAVEVKTTSTKSPYKMHISSEYQLDKGEISDNLYLMFYALRKSDVDGQMLPELIDEIKGMIMSNELMMRHFENGLEDYGYFSELTSKYTTGYTIREEFAYEISDGFPKIVRANIDDGISNCTYDLLSNMCKDYQIDVNKIIEEIRGC